MLSTTKSASFSPQIQTTEKGKLLLFQKYYSRFLKSHIPAKTFASSRIFSIAFFFRKCLWYILWIDSPISVSYKYAPPYHVCFKVSVSHESITFFAVNFYLNQKFPIPCCFSHENDCTYSESRQMLLLSLSTPPAKQAVKVHIAWITQPCVLNATRLHLMISCIHVFACMHNSFIICFTFHFPKALI